MIEMKAMASKSVTVITALRGALYGELLAVQFVDSGQIDRAREACKWLAEVAAQSPFGVDLSGLNAFLHLPGVQTWRIQQDEEPRGWEGDLIRDGGLVVDGASVEPFAPDSAWGESFRISQSDEIEINDSDSNGDSWAWVNLNYIQEQL